MAPAKRPGGPAPKPAAAKPSPSKPASDGPSAVKAEPPPTLAAGLADHDTEQPSAGPTSAGGPSAKADLGAGGPSAPTPDQTPWEAAGPTGEAMLRLAAVHTACLALSDAAHHLRRTAVTVEAANAVALRRSLTAARDDDGWVLAIEGAERIMKDATDSFSRTTEAALQLVRRAAPPHPDQHREG